MSRIRFKPSTAKTQIMNVVMDFPADLSKGIKRISEAIEGLDVGLLVNNIGVLYSYVVMP